MIRSSAKLADLREEHSFMGNISENGDRARVADETHPHGDIKTLVSHAMYHGKLLFLKVNYFNARGSAQGNQCYLI